MPNREAIAASAVATSVTITAARQANVRAAMGGPRTVTQRELNRSLLARQGLLERSPATVPATVERLVAMQAQEPFDPYVALAARLEHVPAAGAERADRDARGSPRAAAARRRSTSSPRATRCVLQPLTLPVLARTFKSSWLRRAGGADVAAVVAAGQELLAERPLTRAELAAALGPRWPDAEAAALAQAVTYGTALVQIPPRALWGRSGAARWRSPRTGSAPSSTAMPRSTRSCCATSPRSARRRGRRAHVVGLHRRARRARAPAAAAAHVRRRGRARAARRAGRRRSPTPRRRPRRASCPSTTTCCWHTPTARACSIGLGPGLPWPRGRWVGTLLVDGFFRAYWNVEGGDADRRPLPPAPDDPPGTLDAIAAEGERLLELIAPAGDGRVRFDPEP